MIDLTKARNDTPGCASRIHFNNAGASLMPRQVLETVKAHLDLEAAIGGYEAADRERERIERVYDSIAALINCRREEIALVEHATRAWDQAFYSVPLVPGDRILTTVSEYAANFVAFLHVAERTGACVDVIPNDDHGQISIEALRHAIDSRVKLIAINHVPTNSGLVNPARDVGRVAREAGALYLLDACQSVGQLPVDVDEIGCDMLSATGRKFLRGPRGTGFLYVRNSALDRLKPIVLDHHAAAWIAADRYELRPDARRFENWEASYADRLGLGAAVDYALEWGMDAIWDRVHALGALVRERLAEVAGVAVRDIGRVKCGITTFTLDGVEAVAVKRALAERNINVTVADAFSARIDMESRGLDSVVRASAHYYNDEDEISRLCDAVASIAS